MKSLPLSRGSRKETDDRTDHPMSKSQLNAFLTKVAADPALKARVDAAADSDAVVAIALSEGHLFSPATLKRSERG